MVCNITWSQGQDQQDEGICICDFIQIINYYFLLAFQYWEYIHKAINVSPHGMKRLCCTTYCFTGFSATASSLISFHCSSFHPPPHCLQLVTLSLPLPPIGHSCYFPPAFSQLSSFTGMFRMNSICPSPLSGLFICLYLTQMFYMCLAVLFLAKCLLGLLSDPTNWGSMFLQNLCELFLIYMV